MKGIILGLVLISTILSFSGFADVVSAQESMPLPSVGDKFVYHVKVTGNREATKEEANEHNETYSFMGTKDVRGQTKNGLVENSKEYNSAWWRIERSDKEAYTDQYLALVGNSQCLYLDVESGGDVTWYLQPMELFEFPMQKGRSYSGSSKTYLWVHDTGSRIVSTYETGGKYPEYGDSATTNVTVVSEKVTVPAGTFDCYKVRAVITVKSGSGVTASTTTDTETFWYSPQLNTFVKFESKLDVSAAFWQHFSGTRSRDLLSYEVKA
jgi:hypothetical protein